MQEDGRTAGRARQRVGGVDVVVVPVRAQDRPDRSITDRSPIVATIGAASCAASTTRTS
jgi:hypothetical protein